MTLTPPRRALLIGGLAAALVVLGAAAVAVYLLAGRGPVPAAATVAAPAASSAPAASKAPRTYTVFGSLTLGSSYTGKPDCAGMSGSGYFDIKAGASMFVLDGRGKEIARGKLDVGHPDSTGCVFQYLVAGVPAGAGTYELSVTGHQGPTFTESEIVRGSAINLTLP